MYWFSKHVFFFSVSYVFVAAGFNILWCLSGNTFFEVDVITKLNSSFYCTYYYWMYGSEIFSLQSPTSFMMTVYIKLCHFINKKNVYHMSLFLSNIVPDDETQEFILKSLLIYGSKLHHFRKNNISPTNWLAYSCQICSRWWWAC